MEKRWWFPTVDLPIGLIVIVLYEYNNYHIKFRILRQTCRLRGAEKGDRNAERDIANENGPFSLTLDRP